MIARASTLAMLLIVLLAAACGGKGDQGKGEPKLTDPAAVPSATPLQNGVLFQLRGREIIVEGVRTAVAVAPTVTPRSYTVVEGDTCAAIAGTLGIQVEDLMAANRTINDSCTNLRPDDILRVPGTAGPTATPRPGAGHVYTVNEGDTCSGIAQSFGVAVEELIAVNGLDADCRTLQPDQILTIP